MNDKTKKIIIIVILTIILLFLLISLIYIIRIKTAKIEVKLVPDLKVEFNDSKKISDFITSINGTIKEDREIDTTELGKQTISFKFKNDDGITVPYSFEIEVVDTTEPLIWLTNSYTVLKDSEIDLANEILCGDNYDNKPQCTIVGEYDLKTAGDYELVYKATDKNGNTEEQPFTLHVVEPTPPSEETPSEPQEPVEENVTLFTDVVKNYKTKNTRIGLDISKWQGTVDFEKLKAAGVEFVMIRVGGTVGLNGEYFVDEQFERNIKEANKHDIDVGIYFYSYSNTTKAAKKDAQWVLKQIKDYDVDLPIAFDWENWKYFNEYHLSFFGLTSMADTFLDEVEKAGYDGMLYSSKIYLENIWMPTKHDIWLAHYTDQTTYTGKYKMWQLCQNGKVDGIEGMVDIDILYQTK